MVAKLAVWDLVGSGSADLSRKAAGTCKLFQYQRLLASYLQSHIGADPDRVVQCWWSPSPPARWVPLPRVPFWVRGALEVLHFIFVWGGLVIALLVNVHCMGLRLQKS